MQLKKRPKGPCIVLHRGIVLALGGRPRVLLHPTADRWFAGTVFANARRAAHAIRVTRRLCAAIAAGIHRDNPKLGGSLDLTGMKIVPLLPAARERVEPKRRRQPKAPPPNLELFPELIAQRRKGAEEQTG